MLTLQSTLKLNDGQELPRLGLGTFEVAPGKTRQCVLWALEAGYRLVDTASMYGNERDVGEAIRASGLRREEVFVTTKLWYSDHGYDSAIRSCRASLVELGLEWVDLYLIHWPIGGRARLESWRALVQLQRDGLCRSIGVSNFTVRHLDELLEHSPVVPAIDQVEMSPFLAQQELRAYCARHGIAVEAYSPLTKGERLSHPIPVAIATRHGKSAAQVFLRWALQSGVVVIPKSKHQHRIRENAQVFDFELSDEEMRQLDGLDEGLRTSWDPTHVP